MEKAVGAVIRQTKLTDPGRASGRAFYSNSGCKLAGAPGRAGPGWKKREQNKPLSPSVSQFMHASCAMPGCCCDAGAKI